MDFLLSLAPLAGYTNSSIRRIYRKFSVDETLTEMISAKGIILKNQKTLSMLNFTKEERPIGIQIFGSEKKDLLNASKFIENNFKPDFININMGCPTKKIIKNEAGAAFLKSPERMLDVSTFLSSKLSISLTIKTRIGWDSNLPISFFSKLSKTGISKIYLHGRTYKQGFSGSVNWPFIDTVATKSSVKIIGNGDITSPYEILNKKERFPHISGIMIGRGALSDPFIFLKAKCLLRKKTYNISREDYKIFFNLLIDENINYNIIKRVMLFMVKRFKYARKMRNSIVLSKNIENIKILMEEFLDKIE